MNVSAFPKMSKNAVYANKPFFTQRFQSLEQLLVILFP